MKNRFLLLTPCFLGLVLTSCGRTPPPFTEVGGVVTVNGKPLPGVEVTFAPTVPGFGSEILSTGVTDEEGRFRLKAGTKEGACVGEHRVMVQEGPVPEKLRGMSQAAQIGMSKYLAGLKNRPIPEKYTSFAQSPLTVTVAADRKEYTIELSR